MSACTGSCASFSLVPAGLEHLHTAFLDRAGPHVDGKRQSAKYETAYETAAAVSEPRDHGVTAGGQRGYGRGCLRHLSSSQSAAPLSRAARSQAALLRRVLRRRCASALRIAVANVVGVQGFGKTVKCCRIASSRRVA